jgi:glycosyltransferase involved in cell wall biosynthesis
MAHWCGHVRILYLALDVKLADMTGDAIHVKEATKALASLGEEVYLAVPAGGATASEIADLAEGRVRVLLVTTAGNVGPARECRRFVKEYRADVIYERRFSPKIGAAVSLASGVPLVVEVNGLVDVEAKVLGRPARGGTVAAPIRGAVQKRSYQRAARVIAVTPALGEEIRRRYRVPSAKIVIIPNGADVDRFRPSSAPAAKKAIDVVPSRPVACFVGTLFPWQGIDHMLNAAPLVVRAVPEILFLIVGNGPLLESLRSAVRQRGLDRSFRIQGQVSHSDVPRYVNAAEVCLALKDPKIGGFESGFSPLKLYEYLACGRPVVATRTAGFEILEEADCGILVDPFDAPQVANAIVQVVTDDERRTKMGIRARSIAVDRFSWLAVAKKTILAIQDAIAQ